MAKKITFEVPDDFDPETLRMLPEGWKLVAPGKGGRPRSDLKRIAVAMAYHWMMDKYRATKTQAIEFVCIHWQHHGVHDESRARQRVKEGMPLLDPSMMNFLPGGGFSFKLPIQNGSRGFMWHHEMHEAVEIEAVNCKATIQYNSPRPVATAVSAACAVPR